MAGELEILPLFVTSKVSSLTLLSTPLALLPRRSISCIEIFLAPFGEVVWTRLYGAI